MSALNGQTLLGRNFRFCCGSYDLVVTPLCRHRTLTVNFSITRLNIFFYDAKFFLMPRLVRYLIFVDLKSKKVVRKLCILKSDYKFHWIPKCSFSIVSFAPVTSTVDWKFPFLITNMKKYFVGIFRCLFEHVSTVCSDDMMTDTWKAWILQQNPFLKPPYQGGSEEGETALHKPL